MIGQLVALVLFALLIVVWREIEERPAQRRRERPYDQYRDRRGF